MTVIQDIAAVMRFFLPDQSIQQIGKYILKLCTKYHKLAFTLIELLVVISIIGVLSVIGLNSFGSARVKARDSNRKSDLSAISKALELYYNDFGQCPDDNGGLIVGCGTDAIEKCTWGVSEFSNDTTGEIYLIKLPTDSNSTYSYYYESFTTTSPNLCLTGTNLDL